MILGGANLVAITPGRTLLPIIFKYHTIRESNLPSFLCGMTFTTVATNNNIINYATTNYICADFFVTNYISSYSGTVITNLTNYLQSPLVYNAGTLQFPDFEMNQDILLPYTSGGLPNLANPLLQVFIEVLLPVTCSGPG